MPHDAGISHFALSAATDMASLVRGILVVLIYFSFCLEIGWNI